MVGNQRKKVGCQEKLVIARDRTLLATKNYFFLSESKNKENIEIIDTRNAYIFYNFYLYSIYRKIGFSVAMRFGQNIKLLNFERVDPLKNKKEKSIEKRLVDGVKALGGRCYKWVSPGNSGVPDRIVLLDGETIFVELKRDGGIVSPIQERQIQRIAKTGNRVEVVFGETGVENFLRRLES